MKISLLPRFLLGDREAILELAASRWTILIGAIFVVSAGFAREYDGEDLINEPWHALRPLGASLASGTTLFLLVHCAIMLRSAKADRKPPRIDKSYVIFLGLFWMTAPMAWLYAIPYERFMSPVDAIGVNLCTLALVAAWRVALITRVISVIYGVRAAPVFFIVMLFADAVVFTVVTMVPTPVIDVMGGIRHTDRDALIASVTFTLVVLSVLTAPIWILGSLVAVGWLRPDWRVERSDSSSPRSLLILAIASVLAFLPAMVVTQPEQVNRRKAESMMLRGDVASAFDFMSARFASDFPPQWNPPPKLGYQEREPELTEVRRVMEAEWPAEWVASIYLEKMGRFLKQDLLYIGGSLSWAQVADRYEQRGDEQLSEDQRAIVQMLRDRDESLTRTDRDALDRLIRLEAGGAEASGDAPSDGT
ncbi:hypothetical protein ABWH91_02835 [Phycisphaerales bacterium ac7]